MCEKDDGLFLTKEQVEKLIKKINKITHERDELEKALFRYVKCPVCKHWDLDEQWCKKHDRHSGYYGGCSTPESKWR